MTIPIYLYFLLIKIDEYILQFLLISAQNLLFLAKNNNINGT